MIPEAIQTHGAQAIYQAACRALEGDYSHLARLGIQASTLRTAWDVQSIAYRAMTPREQASETASVAIEMACHD